MAVDILTDAGFEVIEAAHAGAALVHLGQRAQSIRLIFTDIHMPGTMNGIALANHAAIHWPWIQLLVTSGEATPGPGDLPADARFLQKPYLLNDLVRHAIEMLGTG